MGEPLPLFSVIIPTYNRATTLVRALESVLAQTCPDYDVWVIDDGSNDGTDKALAPYRERIHYLRQPNSGAAAARNHGIQVSRGAYIALLDSDDCWMPTKLDAYQREIQAHPQAGLFYSAIEVVNEAGESLRVHPARAIRGSAYLSLLKGNFLANSSVVIRRACLEETGLFDTSLGHAEDWDLWLRIARGHPIQPVPGVLTRFESAASGKKTSNIPGWLRAHDQIIAKAFRLDPGLSPAMRQDILANIAVVKGRILLEAGEERLALAWFEQAAALRPFLLKAQLFRLLCAAPALRQALPAPLLRRLHLNERAK